MNTSIIDKFLKFEENKNLFNLNICGIKFWHIIRFRIYSEIIRKINKTQINHPKKKTSYLILLDLKNLLTSIYKSPFFLRNKRTIIFNHPRKVINENGFYECKYTEYLTNHDAYVFEAPFQDRHLRPTKTKNLYYLDTILYLGRIGSMLGLLRQLKNKDDNTLHDLKKSILEEFNIEILNLHSLALKLTFKHLTISYLARLILKRIKPMQIITTVAYSDINMPFIEQAKKLGIKTIEVQHGIMGKEHVAYNFLRKQNLNWYPDEIWVWNEFWATNSRFPISNEKIKIKGFPFLEKFISVKDKQNTQKKQILIISQGPFSNKLMDLTLKLNSKIDNSIFTVAFKPHPSEVEADKNKFIKLSNNGIKIISETNIYKTFDESYAQVGVNSTALFEGIEFGLKTFILKNDNSDIFKNNYDVILIENEDDILNKLQP